MAEIKTAKNLPGMPLDRHDWLLCAGRSRDSEILEESNFDAILKHLGGESDTLEVHRFGHWACGWIEEIVVHPSRRTEVQYVTDQLANYPIWDEDDFSDREAEAAFEGWVSFGCREFTELLQEQYDLMDTTRDLLRQSPVWTLSVFENTAPYVLCTEGDKVHVRRGSLPRRDRMAQLILMVRKEIRNHV